MVLVYNEECERVFEMVYLLGEICAKTVCVGLWVCGCGCVCVCV